LARKAGKYYGSTPAETAAIDQWLEFVNSQITPNNPKVIYPIFGFIAVTKEHHEAAKKDLLEVLKIVDSQLKLTAYLGGKEISIADLAVLPSVRFYFRLVLD